MMGQGLAKALQGAGEAVRGYQERKQEKQFTEQTLSNLGNFLKDNPGAVKTLGFNVDPNDKGALKAAVQGFGGGDFKAGAAAISPLMAQYMQQQQMANAFAPEVTTGPSAFQRAAMGGVQFGNLPTDAASGLQPINARPRTPEEITQRLLAAKMPPGAVAAIHQSLVSAEQARVPKPPEDDRTSRQKDYEYAINELGMSRKEANEWVRSGGVTTTVNTGENSLKNALGTAEAGDINKIVSDADKGQRAIEKLGSVLQIIESGDINTGIGANIFTTFDRLRSRFLADKNAGKTVTNDQIIDAYLGADVFPLIGELGIGARGIDTPAERDFLISVFTGSRVLDADALIKLTQFRFNAAVRHLETYNAALKGGRLDPLFEMRKSMSRDPLTLPDKYDLSVPTKRTPINKSLYDEADALVGS